MPRVRVQGGCMGGAGVAIGHVCPTARGRVQGSRFKRCSADSIAATAETAVQASTHAVATVAGYSSQWSGFRVDCVAATTTGRNRAEAVTATGYGSTATGTVCAAATGIVCAAANGNVCATDTATAERGCATAATAAGHRGRGAGVSGYCVCCANAATDIIRAATAGSAYTTATAATAAGIIRATAAGIIRAAAAGIVRPAAATAGIIRAAALIIHTGRRL
jgi:hypothetical protein